MSYSQENGYVPLAIDTLLSNFMDGINDQFNTEYTWETFQGTNHYKYFYALAQELHKNEVKTSEIFLKLTQYFLIINARISRPVVTAPGIYEKMLGQGYLVSQKPMVEADAGKIHICVDVDETADDYAETKVDICQKLSGVIVGGVVSIGDQEETIVLSNGQSFDYKYALPDRIPTILRLTITTSENNMVLIGDPSETKLKLLANIVSRYRLGLNFEPQKYFSLSDAPWASEILLEWSVDDGDNWSSDVFDADFDELLTIELEGITLVEV